MLRSKEAMFDFYCYINLKALLYSHDCILRARHVMLDIRTLLPHSKPGMLLIIYQCKVVGCRLAWLRLSFTFSSPLPVDRLKGEVSPGFFACLQSYVQNYSQTSIKWPSIKRSPSLKRSSQILKSWSSYVL